MLKRHLRIMIPFAICFACVAVNVWLLMTGHYRLPLLVFVLCIVGVSLILYKLPPVATERHEIKTRQVKAARAARQRGWIYVAGLIMWTFYFLSGGAKDLPIWAVFLLYAWSGFLISASFRRARRLNQAAAEPGEPTIARHK